MKKIISLLLALTLVFSLTIPAMADDRTAVPASVMTSAAAENIQKYGNVTLNVTCEAFLSAGYQYGDLLTVSFLGKSMDIPFCSNYSDVDSGSAGIFARSGDTNVLVAINMGDFATANGIATKQTFEDKTFQWSYAEGVEGPVSFTISLKTAGGYYDEYVMRQLGYTNAREDYPALTDEQFANFRAVSTTGMGENTLYRTASPVNPENNRNTYADAALRKAGVTVVMNLADDAAAVQGYEGYAESYYSTIKYVALNMGVDFAAAEFQSKLAEGLRFFAENKGIYAVHCTEGKERAGFVTALLECLMGATYEEVVSDYMVTFYNYYGVTAEESRYDVIAGSNIVKTLQKAFAAEDLTKANLADCAAAYVKQIGLSDSEIAALKQNLAAVAEPVVEPTAEPTTEPAAAMDATYVVVAGDCLWNLAYKFYGKGSFYTKLAEANAIANPNLIFAGQTLVIPAR